LVRGFDIKSRTERHNPRRIGLSVTPIIMRLDMIKVGRILERCVVLVEVFHPFVDGSVVVPDRSEITFEVTPDRSGRSCCAVVHQPRSACH